MSPWWVWDEGGSLRRLTASPTPTGQQVAIRVSHTLLERGHLSRPLTARGRIVARADESAFDLGRRVVVVRPSSANILVAERARCIDPPDGLGTLQSLVLPVLAEVAHALERAHLEPGWVGVVAGSDLRAELVLAVSGVAGARQRIALRDVEDPKPCVVPDVVLRGRVSEWPALLIEALQSAAGPVIAFCTTSEPAAVHGLLSALPPSGRLVLLVGERSAVTQVNFYSDVHRKNVTVTGVDERFDSADLRRAARLLEQSRVQVETLSVADVDVGPEARSLDFTGRLAVLRWQED